MRVALSQRVPNFDVWFGSDTIKVSLLKGAVPIADVHILYVIGSAVGFEDSSGASTLSISKVRSDVAWRESVPL